MRGPPDHRVGLALARELPARPYESDDLIRGLVREALVAGGLGQGDPAAPLADIVSPGDTVLLKPNWVLHFNQSGATMECMITNPAFVRVVLQEVVAARAGRVIIADAPIQSADFDAMADPEWRRSIAAAARGVPVDVLDFRNTIAERRDGRLVAHEGLRPAERFVEFDLGADSLLEPISSREGAFRNTSYDPDRMARVQRRGVHKFKLCREPFEADVVLNLPKLKAHAKAGITAALKNLVGVNGDKDYLPHHRVGGSALGGDCYAGLKPMKRVAERLLDAANRRIGKPSYGVFARAAALARRFHGGDLEGKWAGNDTTWRMVLDLNRIVLYGTADGRLLETPQRRIYSLTDGIVAGEANGPLAPEPMPLGAVTFGSSSPYVDAAHAALMRFDVGALPLVREAFGAMRYPLTRGDLDGLEVHCRGSVLSWEEVARQHGRAFRPPKLWVGAVEWAGATPPRRAVG